MPLVAVAPHRDKEHNEPIIGGVVPEEERPIQTNHVLVAGVPATFERISAILTGLSFDFVATLRAAEVRLASHPYNVILISAHFDESSMFDLMRYLKGSEHAHVPIICFRAHLDRRGTTIAIQGIGTAARAFGAADYIDLFDYKESQAADLALRSLVDAALQAIAAKTPQ